MFFFCYFCYLSFFFFHSLYPWCNKYGKYPIGHPEVITENFANLDQYYGLIKCKIVPPPKLYIPLLPYHTGGKLLFALCRTCAENLQQTPCEHTRDERALTGTWCTIEVVKALELGYEIDEYFEIWHYPETSQYNKATGEQGLFSEYINLFLKLKQEASGKPAWITCEADVDTYINNYFIEEGKLHKISLVKLLFVMCSFQYFLINMINFAGIFMDKESIEKNPGLRSLAKLMLNSMW